MRGRVPVAATLAATVLLLPVAGAQADPKPTIAEAKAKLAKLNKKMDKLSDDYKSASDSWKKAKKAYDKVNTDYKQTGDQVQSLRAGVIGVAVGAYQTSGYNEWGNIFTAADPSVALSGMALLDQLAVGRNHTLTEFEAANKALTTRRDQKKKAYEDAAEVKKDLAKKKKDADETVKEQIELLRRLGAYKPGNTASAGQVYTGPASGNARAALQFAYAQIGKPYRYGGTGPSGWDCSGLVQASWAKGGVSLPRTTYEMWSWGASRRVSINDLQPGDLVFHAGIGHVGLYAGDGKVVHSPQTGDVVKVESVAQYRPAGAVRP